MVKFIIVILMMLILLNPLVSQSQGSIQRTVIKSDHIRIDHYGQHDKPFGSFVISKTSLKLSPEEWPIVVGEKVFLASINEVQGNKLSFPTRDDSREFGIFKVTIMKNGVVKEYYFRSRSNSVSFFKSWIKDVGRIEGSKELTKVLDYILSRIS